MPLCWEIWSDRHSSSKPLSINREHNDTRALHSVVESEDLSSRCRRGGDAVVFGAKLSDTRHEFGIRLRETALVPSHVVLEAGAAMSTHLEAPAIYVELVAADARGDPRRIRHE